MKILLADDHPLVRDALAHTARLLGPDTETCEAADLDALRRLARARDIDLAVVDLKMPGMCGTQSLHELRRDFPTLALVVASGQDDPTTIAEVLACGVSGFIPKNEPCDRVLQALRLVLAGGIYVPRQALAGRICSPRQTLDDGDSAVPRSLRRAAPRLTPRQLIVLGRLLRGRSNKLIARDLSLTEGTVKTHVAAILRELGASSRTEAVVRALDLGLHDEAAIGRE
jgi:DNA-binding NarL/FixJ family response regulator